MERINRILEHPIFKECVRLNEMAEAKRSFCHHDIEHLCAVARIAMLLNLEEGLGLSKDLVYGAALLHDSGRYKQYENGTPHEEAGAEFARLILPECGYNEEEVSYIIDAINSHRGTTEKTQEGALAKLLYRADKMSRNCQFCKVYEECNWSKEKKDRMFIW